MNTVITKKDQEIKKLMFKWYMTGALAVDGAIMMILLVAYLIAINI